MMFYIAGGKAIAVPGEVAGYYTAWSTYGVLPWKDLWQPSICICKHGFKINHDLARVLKKEKAIIMEEPNLKYGHLILL